MDETQIVEMLKEHESRSQRRYESLKAEICGRGEGEMGEGINTDKVIVNAGSGGGEGGLGGLAALMMASRGDDSQSNIWASILPALTNQDRGGMNNMWPLLLLLLRGNGFGVGGGGDCCGPTPAQAAILQTLLEGQSDLRAQVPTVGLETQNAILSALARDALGTQQGFANVKDAIQTGNAFLDRDVQMVGQNVSAQGCQTREWVTMEADKTRSLLVARFQQEDATKIAEQNAEIVALRTRCDNDRHHAETTLTISNTNTAVAQQQQRQDQRDLDARFERLAHAINVGNQIQLARNVNDTINFGTMAASGIQTTPTTQVR